MSNQITAVALHNKQEKLKEIQDKTYKQMKKQLEVYGLCNVVRPTGFGKTKLIADYCHENEDKTFLYIYDTNTNRDNFIKKYDTFNVEFLSYAMLSLYNDEERKQFVNSLIYTKYYCVIFDESHLIGGAKVELVFNDIKATGKVKLLGASANGYRMDRKIVSEEYFDGHEVFDYSMVDAIVDGIVCVPTYTVCAKTEDFLEEHKSELTENEVKLVEECANKGDILLNTLKKRYPDDLPSYMRFICFLGNIEEVEMVGNSNLVRQIKRSLPGYKVNIIKVTSSYMHKDGVEEVNSLTPKKNNIDLICSCNMLNQGMHFDILTGLLFCRRTESDIIFTQQFGRAVSVMQEEPALIIDYVANYSKMKVLGDSQRNGEYSINYTGRHKGTSNKITDICEVIMSTKQLKLLELMGRFEHTRKLDDTVGMGAIVHAYKYFGATIDSICNSGACGLSIADLAQVFDRVGVLRSEDVKYLGAN